VEASKPRRLNPILKDELEDGSRWQIFPGDLDLTLNWKPETDLTVVPSDEISSHMLVNGGFKVHVIATGDSWPVKDVKSARKESYRINPSTRSDLPRRRVSLSAACVAFDSVVVSLGFGFFMPRPTVRGSIRATRAEAAPAA
jgi:hypothetical protein